MTCIAAAAAGLTWMMIDFIALKHVSGLGFCCGAVAGLVGITPGSGFVAPWAAILIGMITSLLCNLACRLKHALGYDDALDVFGTHGIGGFVGNILTGIFAQKWIATLDGATINGGWMDGHWMQVGYQMAGSLTVAAWSFFWSFLLSFGMQKIPGIYLRLKEEDELMGMDLATMGEEHYTVHLPTSAGSDRSIVSQGPGQLARKNQPRRKIDPVIINRPLNKL